MKSTSFIALLLLSILLVKVHASIFQWDDERLFKRDEFHSWLTDAQKAELEKLTTKPTELRDKMLEFYNQLPKEDKSKWDRFYEKYCVVWLKEVASDEEISKLKGLEMEKNKDELLKGIYAYRSRLDEKKRQNVDLWKETCEEYLTRRLSRKRRESSNNFDDFIHWMTDEQRQSVNDMKTEGKSFEEIRKKGKEYFKSLTIDKQSSLKEQFKEKCKKYFIKIANPEEKEKIESFNDAEKIAEIRHIVKNAVARLHGEEKEFAIKMETLCTEILATNIRKNDIDDKINRRLSWMTNEQKQEVKKLYADGRSQADIRAKIFEFLSAIDGPAGVAAKDQIQKECYKWMDEVATTEEIAALHEMHETDHDGCKKKVREFIKRLPEDRRQEVEKDLPFCERIWYGEHGHHNSHGHHGHHRRHLALRRRRHLHAIEKFLDWLVPEQKSELEKIENSGAHFDDVITQVKKFYALLPEEKKTELKNNFKSQCYDWVKEVATSDELKDIIKMHESKNFAELTKKLIELESRLSEDQKHTVEHVREVCLGLWEVENTNKHHEYSLEEAMDIYLSWMKEDDKKKVKTIYETSDRETFYNEVLKIMESSDDEVKAKAAKKLDVACKQYVKNSLGEESFNVIKQMKENGASFEEISKKVDEMIEDITDSERKVKARRMSNVCKRIYSFTHPRQSHHYEFGSTLQKYITWLDDSQKNELNALKAGGNKEEMYNKLIEYFDATTGEMREKATEELQLACNHHIKSVVGEQKAMEIKRMKEEGFSSVEIAKKVEEIIKDDIADDSIKPKAEEALHVCKKIFGVTKRIRRDHSEMYTLEDAMEKYLTWLSDDQKIVVKSIYDVGDREALYEKIMEFFDDAMGETKERASKELKDACKHYVKDLIGEENGNVLREMKENGMSNEAIATKVEEMIEAITDGTKREQAMKASTSCKKIYNVVRRFRRDHDHQHNLEEALEKYLTWLDEDQKAQIKSLYEEGNREDVYKKVLEFFESASEDVKEKATVELKSACRHYVKDYIGDENAEKLKEMKESGVSNEEISKKVDEFISIISDEEKKAKALRASNACKKIYGVVKRFRRDHHDHKHNLEEAMEKYLTWLNEEQKTQIKKLYESENRESMYQKVLEFFETAPADVKEKAAVELKSACRHYVKDYIGDENAEKLKEMKESGVSNEEISKKVDEFISMISDEEKKAKALRATNTCKKIYGTAKRFRREQHHEHTSEEAMGKYLSWLSEEQKAQVKKIYGTGDRIATYNKVMELFESVPNDEKEKATTQLKAACRHYIKDFIGKENVAVIKAMRESGATNEAIGEKIDEFIAGIDDENKKAQAERAAAACKKIYGVKHRIRREHHEINVDEAMSKYLTWLNDEQKDEIKQLREKNEKETIGKKIMEYFELTSGDDKEKAREELKAGCKHYIKMFVGEKKADELKKLRDSGVSIEEMSKKVSEAIGMIEDEAVRTKAERMQAYCQKIFGITKTRRHLAAKRHRFYDE